MFLIQEKNFEPGPSDHQISSLALYHLSYPGSSLNLSLESNAMQGVVMCDTICHDFTNELTSHLFIYSDILESNPGPGSNFSLEFKLLFFKAQTIAFEFTCQPHSCICFSYCTFSIYITKQ